MAEAKGENGSEGLLLEFNPLNMQNLLSMCSHMAGREILVKFRILNFY